MDSMLSNYKIAFALSEGVFCWLFGDFDVLFCALVAFVLIDYVTGVLVAIYEKKVSSTIGFKGISRKAMIFTLVASGNIIDQYIIGSGNSIKTMLIMFYLANKGISVIENAGKVGLPLPEKFKNIFFQLNLDEKDKK